MTDNRKNNIRTLVITVIVLIVINALGQFYFGRFDLTSDKRYTLSTVSLDILENVNL